MNSPNFDAKWLKQIINLPESQFLDFKKEPPIRDEKGDGKFNFAKHLIAFGNIARSTGIACHIIFGVEDESRKTQDLRDYYCEADIKKWDEDTSLVTKQSDGVEMKIRQIANNWIKPAPYPMKLEYGELEDGTFLTYLVIPPQDTSEPFSLSKAHGNFSVGTVFTRVCSSSVPVDPSQIKYILRSATTTYLSRSEWQSFYNFHKAGDFETSQNLLPNFNHQTKDGKDALQSVMNAIYEGKKTILIRGTAGTGKTTLLQRIAYKLSYPIELKNEVPRNHLGEGDEKVDENSYVVTNFKQVMSNTPTSPVPIFMSLRKRFDNLSELQKHLLKVIQKITDKDLKHIDGLLNNETVFWVILLDGVDEIRNKDSAGDVLLQWIEYLPANVQVVLTSRPYAANSQLVNISFELKTLQSEDICYLIKGKIDAALLYKDNQSAEMITKSKNKLFEILRTYPELLEFLDRHRAIDGFLNYYIDIPITPISTEDIPQTLVQPSEIKVQRNDGPIPIIGNDDLSSGDNFKDSEFLQEDESLISNTEENGQEDVISSPRLVQILHVVYEHLRAAEVDRQRTFGIDAQIESDEAAYALSCAAWEGDWKKNELDKNKTKISKDSIDWNLFAGFVIHNKSPIFNYCSDLFQQFLIAEYGYKNASEEMVSTICRDANYSQQVKKIAQLYDEFCQWQGHRTIRTSIS